LLGIAEINAANHRGGDDARDLRRRTALYPARDRCKIFTINGAHMGPSGGFNAPLEIVEEPPGSVKFIFATTEPEGVACAMRSCTHHYSFCLMPPAQLLQFAQ
jgi:DNA polymerase-3 subunit gamma/tau